MPGVIRQRRTRRASAGSALAPLAAVARPTVLLPRHSSLLRLAQDYEAVLAVQPAHPAALLNKAKVHVVLKQLEVGGTQWRLSAGSTLRLGVLSCCNAEGLSLC